MNAVEKLWDLFAKWDARTDQLLEEIRAARRSREYALEDLKRWPYVDEEGHPE